MECTNPWMPNGPLGIKFRCGQCLSCRYWRTQEWATRIQHELLEFKREGSCFVTLTYDWDHVPWQGRWLTLRKHDLQLFFKRLRKSLGKRRIKYFAAGEYGGTNGRPHYHAIILGLSWTEHGLAERGSLKGICFDGPVFDAWQQGIVHVGQVSQDSITYVVGYLKDKPYRKSRRRLSRQAVSRGVCEAPFQVASTRLGQAWALRHAKELTELRGITVHGVQVGTPRYYRKLLSITAEHMPELAKRARAKEGALIEKLTERYLDGVTDARDKTVEQFLKQSLLEYRRSRDARLKARAALRRKGPL